MKKYLLIAGLLLISIIVATSLYAKQPSANELEFIVIADGEEHSFNQPVVTVGNRVYLPMEQLIVATGYSVYKTGERSMLLVQENKDVLFNDDVYTSREGTLSNGRGYVFHGIDKFRNSIKAFIEINNMEVYEVYKTKIQAETIEELLEKVQSTHFQVGTLSPETTGLDVRYDPELHAFMVFVDTYGAITPGRFTIIVINGEDGLVTEHIA